MILALVVSIGLSVIIYFVAVALGLPADIAKGVLGLPAFAVKNIYEFLEANTVKQGLILSGSDNVVGFADFAIRPSLAFILASIMFGGVMLVTGGIDGITHGTRVL